MQKKIEAFERLVTIMDELREQCPWDKKQTMDTLRYLTIEELYELSDAILDKDMKQNPSNGQTNSQSKLNFLKFLVYILTIIMIVGMIIIVIVIVKEFFYKPEENYGEIVLPKSIKIPDKSKVDTIDFDNNNINMLVTLEDGKQLLILIDIKDGTEKSRKYIEIKNQK